MAFYTQSELETLPLIEARVEKYHRKTAATRHYIFLSHSHKDANLLQRVAGMLGSFSDSIYIDWKDDSMPSVTSPATARRLKTKIAATHKFILLATNNALTSTWVPWELGVADQSNGMNHVAILPVTNPPYNWTGNEYIGIYRYIEPRNSVSGEVQHQPAVIDPETGKGQWLRDWLVA